MRYKGIILAGGTGSRLYPMTTIVSKQLLPVYDKPMIYYPLSVLLLAGIQEVLLISNEEAIDQYEKLLGTGETIGINITYKVQKEPNGLAEAFIIGEEFIGDSNVCLVLGDNVFFGQSFTELLRTAVSQSQGATIFGYPVNNPTDFGVVEFDENNKAISLEEKPKNPKSNCAVPGLYFYDNKVVEYAKKIHPSSRGELEITSINEIYLKNEELNVIQMGRGIAWLDTGTPNGMLKASQFVETVQSRQGFYISCIEEIAWRRGFISDEQLQMLGENLKMTDYGKYILSLLEEKK